MAIGPIGKNLCRIRQVLTTSSQVPQEKYETGNVDMVTEDYCNVKVDDNLLCRMVPVRVWADISI